MGKESLTYRLIIFDERVWRRDADRIPKKYLDRIVKKILLLEKRPLSAGVDVKALQQYNNADFRLRVGDYRVLFNKNDEQREIYLLRMLHRSKLY